MYEVPTFLSSIELSIALFGQFHQDFGFTKEEIFEDMDDVEIE